MGRHQAGQSQYVLHGLLAHFLRGHHLDVVLFRLLIVKIGGVDSGRSLQVRIFFGIRLSQLSSVNGLENGSKAEEINLVIWFDKD